MPMTWGWAYRQPDGWLSMEYFVEWQFHDYGWHDIGGDKQNAFICEKPVPLETSTELPAIQTTEQGMARHIILSIQKLNKVYIDAVKSFLKKCCYLKNRYL